jgi:hypothetical protein
VGINVGMQPLARIHLGTALREVRLPRQYHLNIASDSVSAVCVHVTTDLQLFSPCI